MSCDGAVSGLSLHNIVAIDANGSHESEGAESLSDNIGLNITIVVLASPDEATVALNNLSDNIINKSVLVPEACSLHLRLVLLLVEALEGVDEETIVLLENGVLAGELEGEASVECVAETSTTEGLDRRVGVEHTHVHAGLNVSDVLDGRLTSVFGSVLDFNATGFGYNVILAAVLITESVSSDDDWLGPAWNALGNIFDDNRLPEDGAVEDVSDGSVWTLPHLLKAELFDTTLIWGDSGALYSNLVLHGSVSSINRDLIISGITRGNRQVIVLSLQVEVRVDVALLDPLPDDAGHLVTIDVDDGVGNLDLAEGSGEVSLLESES